MTEKECYVVYIRIGVEGQVVSLWLDISSRT